MKKNYIIYAPSFNENSGGAIALHKLCDSLNAIGEKAYLWKWAYKPKFNRKTPLKSSYIRLSFLFHQCFDRYMTCPLFNTPIANRTHLKNSIVIYPEIISGNPLKAKHVVRWFLHKPGFHTGEINYGTNELYFFYNDTFNDPSINPNSANKLKVVLIRDDIYKQTHFGPRKGSCYMLRKGTNKPIVHDTRNAVCIDDMSHQQIAQVFNKVEFFISYDPYTMYTSYAVMCGCKTIVVPDEGISKELWQPNKELRKVFSYGFEDREVSEDAQKILIEHLQQEQDKAINHVQEFVRKCELFFAATKK